MRRESQWKNAQSDWPMGLSVRDCLVDWCGQVALSFLTRPAKYEPGSEPVLLHGFCFKFLSKYLLCLVTVKDCSLVVWATQSHSSSTLLLVTMFYKNRRKCIKVNRCFKTVVSELGSRVRISHFRERYHGTTVVHRWGQHPHWLPLYGWFLREEEQKFREAASLAHRAIATRTRG